LEGLGFLINYKKSKQSPVQRINFLRFTVDSLSMTISLLEEKTWSQSRRHTIYHREGNMSKETSSHDQNFLLDNPSRASCPPTLQVSNLSNTRPSDQGTNSSLVMLTPEAQCDLQWWACNLQNMNGQPILTTQPTLMITTDASLQGWGAHCQNCNIGRSWAEEEKGHHIKFLGASLPLRSSAERGRRL